MRKDTTFGGTRIAVAAVAVLFITQRSTEASQRDTVIKTSVDLYDSSVDLCVSRRKYLCVTKGRRRRLA